MKLEDLGIAALGLVLVGIAALGGLQLAEWIEERWLSG